MTVLGYCCCKNAHGLCLMSLLSQANENQLAFRNSSSWSAEILFVPLTLHWPLTFDLASMAYRLNLLSYKRLGLVAIIVGSFQEMNEDSRLLQAVELIFSLIGWAPHAASDHTWEIPHFDLIFLKKKKKQRIHKVEESDGKLYSHLWVERPVSEWGRRVPTIPAPTHFSSLRLGWTQGPWFDLCSLES